MNAQAYPLIKTLEASIKFIRVSLSQEWEMCFYWDTSEYLAHATVYADGTYSFKVVSGDRSYAMSGLECETPLNIKKILEGLRILPSNE